MQFQDAARWIDSRGISLKCSRRIRALSDNAKAKNVIVDLAMRSSRMITGLENAQYVVFACLMCSGYELNASVMPALDHFVHRRVWSSIFAIANELSREGLSDVVSVLLDGRCESHYEMCMSVTDDVLRYSNARSSLSDLALREQAIAEHEGTSLAKLLDVSGCEPEVLSSMVREYRNMDEAIADWST